MSNPVSSNNLLPHRPVLIPWRDASLSVHVRQGSSVPIIVFVNGLGLPMAAWSATIDRLPSEYALIAYDRFNQGVSPPLPDDVPDSRRDGTAAARDLRDLIAEVAGRQGADGQLTSIVLVAHSIGVAIARLLITNHADIRVVGALFLDPSPVNSDFVSLYPPPRDDEPADLTETREATRRIFHPSVPNSERFNRANFAELLPEAERPVLRGDPYVTLVAHDPPVAFGEGSEKLGIKTKYALQYVEPYWQNYNKGLLCSVSAEKRRGPVKADGADHFIQVGRPDMVADELVKLVTTLSGG